MRKRVCLLFVYIGLMTVLFAGCKKITFGNNGEILPTTPPSAGQDKKDPQEGLQPGKDDPVAPDEENKTTPGILPEDEKQPSAGSAEDNSSETNSPKEEPTEAPLPTQAPTATPSPTPLPLTGEEAKDLLLTTIGHAYDLPRYSSNSGKQNGRFSFTIISLVS